MERDECLTISGARFWGNDFAGPSATPFVGGLGGGASPSPFSFPPVPRFDDTGLPAEILATLPPPRQQNSSGGATWLSDMMDSGLVPASAIATLLPQREDTDAAPFSAPTPPDQPVMPPPPFHLTPEQEAGIRAGAQNQAVARGVARTALSGAALWAGSEVLAVPKLISGLAHAGLTIHDLLDIGRDVREAPDQAVYKNMNDTLNQAYGSANMPGFRSRFPFP